ncbi:hypothetical protein SDC9_157911 [bioreactor metagenome]|uniref:Uncharacterized protein n=1 Tax=bioreactor metagenome TaxID=1076179 RepID=A0A645FAH7_9ZZZZ
MLNFTALDKAPKLSLNCTVTSATPLAFKAGVNVKVPSAATAGATLKRAPLLELTRNSTVCGSAISSAGPAIILVAQLAILCATASSATE